MKKESKLYLNLYWHMHQPDYRDLSTHEYVLPWTYLHAIKDYSDMAHHVEANPRARVSFNFVPILLEQLEDYTQQFENGTIRDPLLALLTEPNLEGISREQCRLVVQSCFKAHHEKMLTPFPHYQRLLHLYQLVEPITDESDFHYLSGQYKADLLVWYHLAWFGESIRQENEVVKSLIKKGLFFTLEDRELLFDVIKDTINGLIPRYKKLMDDGQIELTTTPYYHPILPLLLDFNSAKDAMPFAPLPKNTSYADGRNRAIEHIDAATIYHTNLFKQAPTGMWPAEGAISHASLSLLAEQGVQWAASGQSVLANSLHLSGLEADGENHYLYQPYTITNGKDNIVCFFRDDGLSDKIGFEYASMHATDAINDFIATLEAIDQKETGDSKVVSVILDGENAWEYYPYNGYYFLKELYEALTNHPTIEMTTFSDILQLQESGKLPQPKLLPQIAAGSWVYGTLSTWIGDSDKNAAWDLLCEAKKVYDKNIHALNKEEQKNCEQQLAICEGSDWFWWFGDYNASDSVKSFDLLYRRNLINLYQLLKQTIPENLNQPISQGGGNAENSGTMRRGQND
ncbi:MAG: glycoside hydrolase family 57 protein [Methylophilaceae bacterium]